jgi:hypothetical protein
MMRAKEADLWTQLPVQEQASLEKQGLVRYTASGLQVWSLWPNLRDQYSPWKKKEVREAAEYAIDKAAIAKALGFGYYVPLRSPAPPGEMGYDPKYQGRTYDPAKANTYEKESDQKAIMEKIVRYTADEAVIIPVFAAYTAYMTQPYVHISVPLILKWDPPNAWMEKH